MTIPKDIPPVSDVETPKSNPSLNDDPFAEDDYVPDTQSPSLDSTSLESQGSFNYVPDWKSPYLDVCIASFFDENPSDLSGDSTAAVESRLVCGESELPRGEGVDVGRIESHDSATSNLSGSGVQSVTDKAAVTATRLFDEDHPEYDMERKTKRQKKINPNPLN